MLLAPSVSRLAIVGLLTLCACESRRLPPGNWQGRCQPAPDANGPVRYGNPPEQYVRDDSDMLKPVFEETCHQFQLVTLKAPPAGTSLEKHALDYANRHGLGYRGLNNGLLLMVQLEPRAVRLQIGCGLEDVISDAQANEVLQRHVLPAVNEGSLQDGLRDGVIELMDLARKKTIANEFRPDGCKSK